MEVAVLVQADGATHPLVEELVAMDRPAYSLALRLTGSPADAEDVVQQAYLNACKSLRNGPPPNDARSWFLKVVANAAKNHLRESDRRVRRVAALRDAGQSGSSGPEPEMLTALRAALEVLDPESRALVSLCCEHGCSQHEAADILGIPARTASDRLRAGLERLRTALVAAGFTAAPAVVTGCLQQTAPHVPAALAAKIGSLVSDEMAGRGAVGGAASTAPGGGLAMKLMLGVLAAGVLAGSAAVMNHAVVPGRAPAAAPKGGEAAPAGGITVEHLAWCGASTMYLNGPCKEALALGRVGAGVSDDAGNVWFGSHTSVGFAYPSGRCMVNGSGMISLQFGNDYWDSDFSVSEGPGSAFSNYGTATGFGQPAVSAFVWGDPMAGGDKGCLYFSDGDTVKKVWRNPEQDNRWWFRKIIGGGKAPAPATKGGSVPALEAGFNIRMPQVMPDGRLIVFAEGGFYEYKDGNLACLLGYDDYKNDGPKRLKDGAPEMPTLGVMGVDGAFYLGTYFSGSGFTGKAPGVWRVPPGGGKIEPYIQNRSKGDGPGLWAGFFCGPHFWATMHNYKYVPGDCLFLTAHDDAWIRRARNGRVTTLCPDGEWRELDQYSKGLRRFRAWSPGPNGTATAIDDTFSKLIAFRVSGIDYDKPTVGPLLETPAAAPAADK